MGIRSTAAAAAKGEETVPFLEDDKRGGERGDERRNGDASVDTDDEDDDDDDDDIDNNNNSNKNPSDDDDDDGDDQSRGGDRGGDRGRGRGPGRGPGHAGLKKNPLRPRSFGSSRWHARSPRTIVLLVSLLKFLVAFCYDVFSLPVFRLLEDMYCHNYLKDDSLVMIEEMRCKVDVVQSQLAYMLGWLNLTTSIISLVATLLFGTLADRIGRKPVVKWNCLGIVLSFPFAPIMLGLLQRQVRRQPLILLLGSLFPLVGGGLHVLLAVLYAIAADVSSEEEKASSFVFISFGASSGGLVGSLVAGGLLQLYGPWVPIYLVMLTIPFCFVFLLFIPETLNVAQDDAIQDMDKAERPLNALDEVRTGTIKAVRDLGSSFRLLGNPNVSLILVYFLFHNARVVAYGNLLPQYFSKNFGWQIGQISFLLSPLGVFNLGVLGVTPLVSKLLVTRFGFSGFGKDLWLSRLCTLAFIVGAVIEGFASGTAAFILGVLIQATGYSNNPLARATMTHYVKPELTSSLYMLISVAEVAGVVVGAPVLAWLFTFGMEKGGVLTGAPWFYCACIGGLIWLCLALVRPPREDGIMDCEEGASLVEVEMKALHAAERLSQGSHRP